MLSFIIRRVLYMFPVLVGVNLLVFVLFFEVNPPERVARQVLGDKNVSDDDVKNWLANRGYDGPMYFNTSAPGLGTITDTVFYRKCAQLFVFDFGQSDRDQVQILREIRRRILPSMMIALPMFAGSLFMSVVMAMFVAHYRGTYLDLFVLVLCVVLMSISELFYIISGQHMMGKEWKLFPISGYQGGLAAVRFTALPALIGMIVWLGANTRFYRTVFLEEVNRDYVRTARAKGLGENSVLFKHVLKNAMIPIITSISVWLPLLFLGSLLLERFFNVPGLGSFTIDAIDAKDFAIVRAMVFLSAILYVTGMLLTDIGYTLVDPRVRLE